MAHQGDDSGADPNFVVGGDFEDMFCGLGERGNQDDAPMFGGIGEDAPNTFVGGASLEHGTVSPLLPPQSGSETVGGNCQQRGRKRKNREIGGPSQPVQKEGMSKDKKFREKKKVNVFIISFAGVVLNFYYITYFQAAQQEIQAENEELKREIEQLKLDKVRLEWEVLHLKAEIQKQTNEGEIKVVKLEGEIKYWKAIAEKEKAIAEKEKAIAEKEKAVAEKEKAEKRYIQRELEFTTQMLQTQTEEPQRGGSMFSLRQRMLGSPPKLVQGWATRINPSTKLPSPQGREEFLNSIHSSVMSLLKYTTTKMDAKRLAVEEDYWHNHCLRSLYDSEEYFCQIETSYNWEKEIHRIEKLCILNSQFETPRKRGSNWIPESLIREEIYRTLCSCCESLEGEYVELMALARRIRDSTILQSYAGDLDCDLIDLELGRQYDFGWRNFYFMSCFHSRSIEILHSIRRYAESLRVEKKPLRIMQVSFASPREMWSGNPQSFYKPLRKNGVRNLYELRSFCRLLVVKRRLELRIKKLHTLRSHFDPPRGRGELVILVNAARSVWKFRCATQATRKPVIVGDLVDDQIVFYEGDLPTEAHYRSEIAIVGLGLVTWVELESYD